MHRIWPSSERHLGEVGVRVSRVGRYFPAKPVRLLKNRVFMWKLNFGNDQASVLPLKHVNLPNQALPRNLIPKLLDDPAFSQAEQSGPVCHRDLVFELKPPNFRHRRFDRQCGSNPIDKPHAERHGPVTRKIALPYGHGSNCRRAPVVIPNKEFPFDFVRHHSAAAFDQHAPLFREGPAAEIILGEAQVFNYEAPPAQISSKI